MLNMLPTVVRNFFTGRATRMYPVETRDPFPQVRGELKIDEEKCNFCVRCSMVCPAQCITVDRKEASWKYDPYACVYCGVCIDVCSDNALYQEGMYRPVVREKSMIYFKGELKPKKKKEDAPAADAKPAAAAKPESPAPAAAEASGEQETAADNNKAAE